MDPTVWVPTGSGGGRAYINNTDTLGGDVLIDSLVDMTMPRFGMAQAENSTVGVQMTGGTILVSSYSYFGFQPGASLTVTQSGGRFMVGKNLSLGKLGGTGTWNLSGGLLEGKGAFKTGGGLVAYAVQVGADDISAATINLSGDGLLAGQALTMGALGLIDLTGGAMKFTGFTDDVLMTGSDYTQHILDLITAGKIINSTGEGLSVSYDPAEVLSFGGGAYSVAGVTTVTLIPEPATMAILALGGVLIRRKK